MSTHKEFFYFGICHFCKNISEKIQRCASCKTVAYCSKQHQKSDWRNHRDLCKAISYTSKNAMKNCTFEEWKSFRIYCQLAWTSTLKRQLEPFESQMWMFPRVCDVCYSRENLVDCNECRNVAYCSNEHERQHKAIHAKFCKSLKLCMEVDQHLAKENSYPETQLLIEKITSLKQPPRDMEELMNFMEKEAPTDDTDEQVKRVLKGDCLAPGATILYAIKTSQITQLPGIRKKHFVIHLVGSSAAEGTTDWELATELIFHLLQDLDEITYIFIGPEAWPISENLNLCQSCKTDGKVLNVKVYKQLYHELVDVIEKPNLVLSFNSGLHEFEGQKCDQWLNSIPCLLKNPEIPFIFTSYTKEEMTRDLQRLQRIPNAQLSVVVCGKNHFASPRPIRDWCTKDIPIFYSNGYIAIVKRQ